MTEVTRNQELFLETLTLWAEANQRVLGELVELGASTAREGLRLYADFQRTAVEAMRQNQSAALRWQSGWKDAAGDPAAWYRKAVAEGVGGAQQAFKATEENAQALSRSVERIQASTEQAGKGIQDTLSGTVSKVREIYSAS
jgi:hypothetical protein